MASQQDADLDAVRRAAAGRGAAPGVYRPDQVEAAEQALGYRLEGPDRGRAIAQAPTELERRLAEARAMRDDVQLERRDGHPGQLPDVERQLTMARGALVGVQQRAAELVAQLQPVLRDDHDQQLAKAAEAERLQHRDREADADELAPRCALSRQLRELQLELGELERVLAVTTQLVQL